jgi:hypothetical protein
VKREAERQVSDQDSGDDEQLQSPKLASRHSFAIVDVTSFVNGHALAATQGGLSDASEEVPSAAWLTGEIESIDPRPLSSWGDRNQGKDDETKGN